MTRAARAVGLALELLIQSQKIGQIVLAAQTEGRDITDEEWALIDTEYEESRNRLRAAIDTARSDGR